MLCHMDHYSGEAIIQSCTIMSTCHMHVTISLTAQTAKTSRAMRLVGTVPIIVLICVAMALDYLVDSLFYRYHGFQS